LDANGIWISISSGSNGNYNPAVTFGAAYYLVTWQSGSDPNGDIYGGE